MTEHEDETAHTSIGPEVRNPQEVELHDLEQERKSGIPHTSHGDDDEVIPDRQISNDLLVVAIDGEGYIGPFERADRKLAKGKAEWETLIFPFKVHTKRLGSVEITPRMRFYFDRPECEVVIDHAEITGRGQIKVRLTERGARYPSRSWTFRAQDLARYLEAAQLQPMENVNNRIEEALGVGPQ